MPVPLVYDVYDRVRTKLVREPVEDLRVDFGDGYGQRSDEEEDRAAGEVAAALAAAARAEDGPPFVGYSAALALPPPTKAWSTRQPTTRSR
jgi:hypothetical protein